MRFLKPEQGLFVQAIGALTSRQIIYTLLARPVCVRYPSGYAWIRVLEIMEGNHTV